MISEQLTYSLVRFMIRKAIRDIRRDPQRKIRALTELVLENSRRDGFQRNLFGAVHTMLEDEESAYYRLIERTVQQVRPEALETLGLNLGYNAAYKGARVIRALEEERGCGIPWVLSLCAGEDNCTPQTIEKLVREGRELGIYVYCLHGDAALTPENLALIQKFGDCTFGLFVSAEKMTEDIVANISMVYNCIVSVTGENPETLAEACAQMRRGRLPYAVHTIYGEEQADVVPDAGFLDACEALEPALVFLFPREAANGGNSGIKQRVRRIRAEQRHAFLLLDVASDLLEIEQSISSDSCLMAVPGKELIWTSFARYQGAAFDISRQPLARILCAVMGKKT